MFNSSGTCSTSNRNLGELLTEVDEDFYKRLRETISEVKSASMDAHQAGEEDGWDDEDDDEGPAITTGTGYGAAYRDENLGPKLEDRSTHFLAIKITEPVSHISIQ